MKWLAGALLLLNLAVGTYFFWAQGQSREGAGSYAPINAEKIQLLGVRLAGEPAPPAPQSQAAQAAEPICVEWRGLAESELERAREAVRKLTAEHVLSMEELPVERMYWVIFPPLPSVAASQVKLMEIMALKVKGPFIIKDGPWKNGISFGLYASEGGARRYLQELEKKGVTGLRLETKPKDGTDWYYLIRSEDAAALRALEETRASLPATTLTRVACRK